MSDTTDAVPGLLDVGWRVAGLMQKDKIVQRKWLTKLRVNSELGVDLDAIPPISQINLD